MYNNMFFQLFLHSNVVLYNIGKYVNSTEDQHAKKNCSN